MSKSTEQPAAPAAAPVELTLIEWCTRKSAACKRVELLAAFFQHAKAIEKSTESDYEERFAAFASAPA